jgi:threonine dehydratase
VAARTGTRARIYMPVSTPRMKQAAVRRHGGDAVEIIITGDNYDDAARAAAEASAVGNLTFVHAYDDLLTMAGQGTLADEVVMSGEGPFDVALLQIGGGGMAAGVACWLRTFWPSIQLIGVEGVDQASMAAAFAAGGPVALPHVDVFSDGTAVRKAGTLTYPLCRELLDELITVTNEELCAATQALWEAARIIPEPAGAMGVAGALKLAPRLRGKRVLSILCGANMDFGQLAWIARHAGIGSRRRRYLRFEIGERSGTLLDLLEGPLDGLNIAEFQYGKSDEERAWPVLAIEANEAEFTLLERRLAESGIPWEDVTSQEDVEFRLIHYNSSMFRHPMFIKLEFPERPGALRDFLRDSRGAANICYFNYVYTGENVGRALVGFEFESESRREEFSALLARSGRRHTPIDRRALSRIL